MPSYWETVRVHRRLVRRVTFRRVRFRRVLAAAAGLAIGTGALAGCGSSSGSGSSRSITLYSGQHPETTQAEVSAFQQQSGIHVRVRSGDENALVQQLEQEGSSSPADVVLTENSPALMSLQGKGLLTPLPADTLASVPAKYNSPSGEWVGFSARVSVIVYNTGSLSASQVPTSILDLANPRWKGKLALAPTEPDFQPIVTSVALAEGEQAALQWLKGVKSNASGHIEPDNETVTADVGRGQAALGVIDHYYWYRMAKNAGGGRVGSQIAFLAPGDPGYVIDVSGTGVLKSSHHKSEADQFVAFLVSQAGQQALLSSNSFEYPLREGVGDPPGLKPFSELQPAPVTVAQLGDGSIALRLLQEAQLI
jgi:iron(III) transport system substrate-binding protein